MCSLLFCSLSLGGDCCQGQPPKPVVAGTCPSRSGEPAATRGHVRPTRAVSLQGRQGGVGVRVSVPTPRPDLKECPTPRPDLKESPKDPLQVVLKGTYSSKEHVWSMCKQAAHESCRDASGGCQGSRGERGAARTLPGETPVCRRPRGERPHIHEPDIHHQLASLNSSWQCSS